ncbi:MAG TPA: hypothetical protein VIL74_10285 [Pyrinomonadaceae bacterium]|jgi:hypothetical protein
MKSNRIIVGIAGVLLFLSIVLTFVVLTPKNATDANEIGVDEAMVKIRNQEITEVIFNRDFFQLVDKNKQRYFVKPDPTDTAWERLLNPIEQINAAKPGTIKTTLEQNSYGWGWIILLNSLSFFILGALTLGVIVYAVKALSRNKS